MKGLGEKNKQKKKKSSKKQNYAGTRVCLYLWERKKIKKTKTSLLG